MKSVLLFVKGKVAPLGDPVRRVLGLTGRAARVRGGATVIGIVVSVSLLFVGLFYVWTRMQIVQIGYELSVLESRNEELKNRKKELLLEIASLQSPGELEKKARKLGLVTPAMGRVVHVP